ncbi:hypothetical protein [Niallia sp. NCCP-28]|nr:hypothetical protein [Niallia sp. NCCP-28]GKU81619.1 hypothetical protein NCCP28_10150 [Niallia sp. NCCP-28]
MTAMLEEKKLTFMSHDVSCFSDDWKNLINDMLTTAELKVTAVNH